MKTRRIVAAVLAALLFAMCFSACGKTDSPSEKTTTTDEVTAKNNEEEVGPYVVLDKADTGYGLMTIPKFNENKLDKESAVMANEMFADVRVGILKNIEEYKAVDSEKPSKDEPLPPLCTVKTALFGTTLSVLVEYNYYFSSPQDFQIAINFNTESGKVINPRDVVKSAGFTEKEVKAALRCFADRSLFDEWEHSVFAGFAETKTLPDGLGDPSYGWQDTLDDLEREYDAEQQPLGKKWDALLISPTVFVDETGSLFVGANIPTEAESGFWSTMVKIGHSDAETRYINKVDRNGELYKAKGAMTEMAAYEAVAFTMGLDKSWKSSSGVKYKMEDEYIENMEGVDGVLTPAYRIKVFTDEGTHIATAGRYAVGVFTGNVWEYDAAADKWNICPNGTGFLPESIYTGMQEPLILASVYNEPNELEEWCVPEVDEVDLVAYATGKNYYETDSETAVIFAKSDNTKVTFLSGTMNGDNFVKKSELKTVMLASGEGVLVHMIRPEGIPSQAIIVEAENDTGSDSGTYVIRYYGKDEPAKTEYITSDSAAG